MVGGAWVCQNKDQSNRWIRLVDLYEAEKEFQVPLKSFTGKDYREIQSILLEQAVDFFSESFYEGVSSSLREIEQNIQSLDVDLAVIDDAAFRVMPSVQECPEGSIRYAQLANFTGYGTILINQRLFNDPVLSEMDKAALMFHESIYAFLRSSGEVNSVNTRKIVGYIFSSLNSEEIRQNVGDIIKNQEIEYVKYEDWAQVCGQFSESKGLLHQAVSNGQIKKVRLIIQCNVFVIDVRDNSRNTPLHIAADKGYIDIVRLLLSAGSDINARDDEGETPLSKAASHGHERVVEFLIDAGARLDEGSVGLALIRAARYGYKEIVAMLVAAGADIDRRGGNGYTALMTAVRYVHGEIVEMLIDAGADLDLQEDYERETALIKASRMGLRKIAEMLIEASADLNRQDRENQTALIVAVQQGHREIVQRLIAAGAHLELRSGDYGLTAIFMPLLPVYNHGENSRLILQDLIDAGADVNRRCEGWCSSKKGLKNPMGYALRHGRVDMTEMLANAGAKY